MFEAVLTDTFGGEPNYSWVRKASLPIMEPPHTYTRRTLIRDAKRAVGIKSRHRIVHDDSDFIELRFPRECLVLMIQWNYRSE